LGQFPNDDLFFLFLGGSLRCLLLFTAGRQSEECNKDHEPGEQFKEMLQMLHLFLLDV